MKNKRKSVRFQPEPGTLAKIDFRADGKSKKFNPKHIGLVVTEASKGCSVVLANELPVKVGAKCRIKVGEVVDLLAEVRWVIPLDDDIQKIGFQFLE